MPLRLLLVSCLVSTCLLAQVPQSSHVWLITEENHSYEDMIGNSDMPYFNSLANQYGLATQYYSNQHSSLSALMWLVAGQPVTSNPDTTSCYDVDNMVRELLALNLTWKAYEEDLPYPGFQGLQSGNYVRRHNPLIDFTDSCTASQELNSVPYTQLAIDMQNDATPNYAYITPNLQDDGHDGTLAQEDAWLAAQVPAILARPEFQPGGDGLLFIVADEGNLTSDDRCSSQISTGCGGHVATVLIGPQVKPAYQSQTLYAHENLLATVCAALGLKTCPTAGATASPMLDFFNTVSITTPFSGAAVASPVPIVATTADSSNVYSMQVYVDNTLQYQVSANSVNTSIPMAQGKHYVLVQSWDNAGGIHKRGEYVTVQSEAVLVKSPSPNAVVSSPVAVSALGGGQKPVNTMQVYVDNVLTYQVNASSVQTHISISPGVHTFSIQATDNSGGVTSNTFTITVANPSLTIASPSNNLAQYSPIQLTATTLDASPVTQMQVYVDNVLQYQETGNGINTPWNMSVGQHYLLFQGTDTAGRILQQGVNVNVLNIPVTISTPAPNAVVASPVAIQASAPDDSPITTMQLYVDNVLQYQVSGNTVNTSLTMANGQHYLVAQAWDAVGNTYKTGIYITVNGQSGVKVSSPINKSQVSSPVHFVASAFAPNCQAGIDSMQIYSAPGVKIYSVHASSLNTWLALSSGLYNATVQAWDKCGNVFKTPVTFTVF
ncbi:MAG TPA: alkaline phosphatase family protein [Terriglobales bacterium]|nr:alkaline phosphatase family protein [Terriglobales bacterium]